MIRITSICLLACALVLSACGSERSQLPGVAANAFKSVFSRNKQPPLTTAAIRKLLTPELRAQIGLPVLIAELPLQKVAALVVYETQNGATITWKAPDGVAIYTKGGLLTGTRGVGYDLMGAHVDGPLSIITGTGNGTATRIQKYIDGENQEVFIRFECHYVGDKNHVSETCATKDLKIENSYWLSKSGDVQSSRQWAGARNGYMLIEAH